MDETENHRIGGVDLSEQVRGILFRALDRCEQEGLSFKNGKTAAFWHVAYTLAELISKGDQNDSDVSERR